MFNKKIKKILLGVIILALLYLIFNFAQLTLSYKHLPGPVYGGDVYRDRGFIQSIVVGFDAQDDGYFLNHAQYYNWGMSFVLGNVIKLFNLNIEQSMLWFAFFIYLGCITMYYFIGKEVFGTRLKASLVSLLGAIWFIYPSVKFTQSANLLLLISIYFLFKYINTKKGKYNYYSGSIIAFCGLIYGATYFPYLFFYAIWNLIEVIKLFRKDLKEKIKLSYSKIKKYFVYIIPTAIAGIIPFVIHYLPLMLRYGSHNPNPVYEYGDIAIENYNIFYVALNELKKFFNVSHWVLFCLGILALLGLLLFMITKGNKSSFFKKYYFLNFIPQLHHYITKPLMGKWFFPHKMGIKHFIFPIFIVKSIDISKLFKKYKKMPQILFLIILVLSLIYIPIKINQHESSKWVKYGQQMDPSTQMIYDVGNYLKIIINNNETILANDETSFALMALSGKKVVISRRTHASYYVDIDKRIADTAIILYGNNSKLRKDLLNKYKTNYFYEDQFLHSTQMNTRVEFSNYLSENGVNFTIKKIPIDPATTIYYGTVYERIIIMPRELNENFIKMLKPVRQFKINSQIASVLYRINN